MKDLIQIISKTYQSRNFKLKIVGFGLMIFFLPTMVFSCTKDNIDKFYYEETYCADPWERNISDKYGDQYQGEIKVFLADSFNIIVEEITVTKEKEGELCDACVCKSGRYIWANAKSEYSDKLVKIGFMPNDHK